VVPCDEIVVNSLRPCVIDIAYGDQSVSDTCCGGILSLRQLAKTKMESRSIFTFLKKFLHGFPYTDYHVRLGASLPEKCGVILPYVISPTMDCNMYDWLSLQFFFFFLMHRILCAQTILTSESKMNTSYIEQIDYKDIHKE
jgi:hypothetical protein